MSNSIITEDEFYDFDSWNFDPDSWDTRFLSLAPAPKRVRIRGPRSSGRSDAKPEGFTKSREQTALVNEFIESREIFNDSAENRMKTVKIFKSWTYKFFNSVQEVGRDQDDKEVMTVGANRLEEALASANRRGRETKCMWSSELYSERNVFIEHVIIETHKKTLVTMVAKNRVSQD